MPRSEIAADLTATVEDYLQSIYSLETEGERIISARLARWMRVTPPTAWATVRRMARDGLVSVDAKKTIHLTKRGRELAEKVARRHRLSERFLNDVLGLGWAEALLAPRQSDDLPARQPDSRHGRCPQPRSRPDGHARAGRRRNCRIHIGRA